MARGEVAEAVVEAAVVDVIALAGKFELVGVD